MKIKIEYFVKAILSGVEESIIGNLEFGNNYSIIKDSLSNPKLWEDFDYTVFGIRRMYESSRLNDTNLEIALLNKNFEETHEIAEQEDSSVDFDKIYILIDELEDRELKYVDETMRNIRLFSDNCFNIKEILFTYKVIDCKNNNILFDNIQNKIPLPDRINIDIPNLSIKSKEIAKEINSYLLTIDEKRLESNFSNRILNQVCFLYDQSYTAPTDTIKFMVCVIGMESILVDGKTELSYRFARNGSMLLSKSSVEYWELTKTFKDIYNKRSQYVHTGILTKLTDEDISKARELLRKIIFIILDENKSKEDLLKMLEIKGFVS